MRHATEPDAKSCSRSHSGVNGIGDSRAGIRLGMCAERGRLRGIKPPSKQCTHRSVSIAPGKRCRAPPSPARCIARTRSTRRAFARVAKMDPTRGLRAVGDNAGIAKPAAWRGQSETSRAETDRSIAIDYAIEDASDRLDIETSRRRMRRPDPWSFQSSQMRSITMPAMHHDDAMRMRCFAPAVVARGFAPGISGFPRSLAESRVRAPRLWIPVIYCTLRNC